MPLLLQQQQPADTYFDPSTSDGSFAAGHTHAQTRTHHVCMFCVCVCAPVVCPWRAPYCVVPVIRTSEVISMLEREPNAHHHHKTCTRATQVVCVCVSESCVQATRTKTVCVDRYIECCCCGAYCGTSLSPFACA
jgi:hypothetical protein